MADYIITVDDYSYDVELDKNSSLVEGGSKFDAVLSETEVANKFVDLSDVSINEASLNSSKTNFVVVYNHSIGQFELVDPDQVLVASASSTAGTGYVGLPTAFVDTLEVDLDQKIDLDAGTF